MTRILFICLMFAVAFVAAIVAGCAPPPRGTAGITIVMKHGKIEGDPAFFAGLLKEFEDRNHGIYVRDEALPSSTDEQHQFYVINLEGRSADFDVVSLDIVWVPEFARAGWLRDVSRLVPPAVRREFFPGSLRAGSHAGRVYAVPWYIDAGILYYREDLLR